MTHALLRRFAQVDVFTATAFMGNPVAVILDGAGLNAGQMQAIANWTNLSETTFVLPASNACADYQLRIFTPKAELPFAGHPTIGTAHALLHAGLVTPTGGQLVQQSAVGLVPLHVPDDWQQAGVSFRLPPHRMTPAPEVELLCAAIGGDGCHVNAPSIVDVGPRWVIAQLDSAGAVRALTPDMAALAAYDRRHGTTGLTIFAEGGDGEDAVVVRSFAPAEGVAEDPVCGSGNGSVAAYRLEHGAVNVGDAYAASQGREVGRDGRIAIRYDADGSIHVGGQAVVCITGTITA